MNVLASVARFVTRFVTTAVVACCLLTASARPASAGAVLTSGAVSIGIFDEGNLAYNVGIHLAGVGDAVLPSCDCEGWGVAANGISGFANAGYNMDDGGAPPVNLTAAPLLVSGNTATSVVQLTSLPELQVTQVYAPAYQDIYGGGLFSDTVTLQNLSATETLTNVLFRRVMDWDVPPTESYELVSIGGVETALQNGTLIRAGNNGLITADPLTDTAPLDAQTPWMPCPVNSDFPDCGPEDHGSVFDFAFGDLAPGEARTFKIFFGAAYTEVHALQALHAVGTEVYSLGQSDGGQHSGWPGTFMLGFDEVGGETIPQPVPEPASLLLFGTGLSGIVAAARRRRARSTAK